MSLFLAVMISPRNSVISVWSYWSAQTRCRRCSVYSSWQDPGGLTCGSDPIQQPGEFSRVHFVQQLRHFWFGFRKIHLHTRAAQTGSTMFFNVGHMQLCSAACRNMAVTSGGTWELTFNTSCKVQLRSTLLHLCRWGHCKMWCHTSVTIKQS